MASEFPSKMTLKDFLSYKIASCFRLYPDRCSRRWPMIDYSHFAFAVLLTGLRVFPDVWQGSNARSRNRGLCRAVDV